MSGPGHAPARPALDLPAPPPLTDAERAEAQRWTSALSRIADPEVRQVALTTVPAQLNRPSGATSPGGWA